jgi:hypothetical protein
MFTTGLLANIGRLTLASAHPAGYSSLLTRALEPSAQLAMEQSLFGFNHLNIAALMQDWKIPELFCDAVLHVKRRQLPGPVRASGNHLDPVPVGRHGRTGMRTAAGHRCRPGQDRRALPQLRLAPHDFIELYRLAGEDWQDWTQTMHIIGKRTWQHCRRAVHDPAAWPAGSRERSC